MSTLMSQRPKWQISPEDQHPELLLFALADMVVHQAIHLNLDQNTNPQSLLFLSNSGEV